MSYARFGWGGSDVYVYMHVAGRLECCGCVLGDDCFKASATESMVNHLAEHSGAGHVVPDTVVADLRADDPLNFPADGGSPAGTQDRRG